MGEYGFQQGAFDTLEPRSIDFAGFAIFQRIFHVGLDESTKQVGGVIRGAEYLLEAPGEQGSHLLSSFANANCLVEVAPDTKRLLADEMVEVLLLS